MIYFLLCWVKLFLQNIITSYIIFDSLCWNVLHNIRISSSKHLWQESFFNRPLLSEAGDPSWHFALLVHACKLYIKRFMHEEGLGCKMQDLHVFF